ncbi:hypothetical protein EsDP_00001856 [Epichloe bromicola]|uniref:Secreted protein n=1 Tax=Epichloe bromicola TaxID=79588 RepID=A0ABQ0CJ22_9HYPO
MCSAENPALAAAPFLLAVHAIVDFDGGDAPPTSSATGVTSISEATLTAMRTALQSQCICTNKSFDVFADCMRQSHSREQA